MRPNVSLVLLTLLLAGCGTSPISTESTRGVVLSYLGGDVGTAGPFGKGGKRELEVLSPAEQKEGEALIDRGAVLFLVYGGSATQPKTGSVSRIVFVQNNKVIRDFVVQPK